MCSNCYNGCTEPTSDQCVRYTGVDVPVLGIRNGDSLSFVEQAIVTFLVSTLDGTGIKPTIPSEIICSLVQSFLPACEDITEVDLFKALSQAACSLQTQITTEKNRIDVIEGSYTLSCVTGVGPTDGTHAVLQAVITKLCSVNTDLAALALNVSTNYVALADLNTLIAAYLASIAPSDNYSNRMIPYTAIEYYGSLGNFDLSGAGIGLYENIYLCNGNNGTPDKRGRVPVGAIAGVPGGAMVPAVNPASSPFNPNYALGDTIYGTNSVILDTTQIPSHSHAITDVSHTHFQYNNTTSVAAPNTPVTSSHTPDVGWTVTGNADYVIQDSGGTTATVGLTSPTNTGITTTQSTGGGLGHDNKQPTLACYYIMYIP